MWIRPSYDARDSPVSAPFQTVSPVGVAGLVQVGREQVEVLVALGEVQAGVAHVRALLGGDDVQRLLGQVAAEVDRHPADVGVARDLDALGGDVVDLAARPSPGSARGGTCAPGATKSSNAPACSAWPSKSGARQYSRISHSAELVDDRERCAYCAVPGSSISADDLDRLLDLLVLSARRRRRRRSRTPRWPPGTCPRRRADAAAQYFSTSSGCSSAASSSELTIRLADSRSPRV